MQSFKKISQDGLDQSQKTQERWLALESAFKLALMPETISEFIRDVSPTYDYSALGYNFHFSLSARIALASMPEIFKKASYSVMTEELQKEYSLKKEGKEKLRRRNLEAVLYYVNSKTLLHKARQLDRQIINENDLVSWLDKFWSPLMNMHLLPTHGRYSFSKVLETAKIIQKEMSTLLDESHIDLYGSFPNMKANLASSDIDIHFSNSLMQKYLTTFGENRDYSSYENILKTDGQIPENGQILSKDLQRTELALAKSLNRPDYKPASLMTVVPIDPTGYNNFFKFYQFQMYNSMKVRIYKDRLELLIFDYFSNKMLTISIK